MEVRVVSDHCPVVLDSTPPVWGPTLLRFENMWSFADDFAKWWKDVTPTGWEGYKFMTKLKIIKQKVKKWNAEVFGDLRLQKTSLIRKIKDLDVLESSGNWNN